jgi:dienelactone hydrolase
MKKFLKVLGAIVLVTAIILVGLKVYGDARFYSDYDPALPLKAEVAPGEVVDDVQTVLGVERPRNFKRVEFSYEARPGERVPGLMALPLESQVKAPVVIFLHGSGQRKEFIDEIATPFTKAGFAMVSFDQFLCGGRKVKGRFANVWGWRNRIWKTVNDTRRLIDFLHSRSEFDPGRIYLAGASYGASAGTVILAKDKRVKAGALVVGGGNLDIMLNAPLIREHVPAAVLFLLKPVAKYFVGVADPVRHAPQTAGTPVIMQNGSDDRLIYPEAGKALYAALGEPKEIKWYPIDHPGLRKTDGPAIVALLNDTLDWFLKQDEKARAASNHSVLL